MSVSTLPKDAAQRRGETVSNRHYVARLRCPKCGKRYAKPRLFVAHLKGHAQHRYGTGTFCQPQPIFVPA